MTIDIVSTPTSPRCVTHFVKVFGNANIISSYLIGSVKSRESTGNFILINKGNGKNLLIVCRMVIFISLIKCRNN